MTESQPDSFEQKLAALAEDFKNSLTATRAEIAGAWNEALAENETARARLLVLVHRLSGSAASFGLPEVAHAAEVLELELRRSKTTAPHADLMAALDRELADPA